MSFNPSNFKGVKMPQCCGTCSYASWDEFYWQCENSDNYIVDADYGVEYEDSIGSIEYGTVCDNWEPWCRS